MVILHSERSPDSTYHRLEVEQLQVYNYLLASITNLFNAEFDLSKYK